LYEIRRTWEKNGQVISSVQKTIPQNEIEDLKGFEANKITSNPYGGQWVRYEKKETDYIEEINELFKSFKFDKKKPFKHIKSTKALKVMLSDMHVGMCVKNSLFGYSYGAKEFNKSLDKVFNSIINSYNANSRFDCIIIQDFGDSLDGYNGETTRGGHKLEQNMSNAEAFKTYINGKLNLINRIYEANITNSIKVYNSVNCNHSGDFGYMANYAMKLMCEKSYKNVEYVIFEKFIEHFYYGEHCFIQSHGKDKQYMKHGMPLKLDDKTINYIGQYIDKMRIESKYIHFEKGDLHQLGYNRCKKFDYRNYMSLAPPSNWVQHNFSDSYSGYSLQLVDKNKSEIEHVDIFVDYSE